VRYVGRYVGLLIFLVRASPAESHSWYGDIPGVAIRDDSRFVASDSPDALSELYSFRKLKIEITLACFSQISGRYGILFAERQSYIY
jgi:hypothetical protein